MLSGKRQLFPFLLSSFSPAFLPTYIVINPLQLYAASAAFLVAQDCAACIVALGTSMADFLCSAMRRFFDFL